MKEKKEVKATYKYELRSENTGTLRITGVNIPCCRRSCDPLGKIWSSVRKKVLERDRVHISALFKYTSNMINCDFFVDYAYGETAKIANLVLNQRFEKAFPYAMADFEDALEAFFKDEVDGYYPYVELFNSSKGVPDGDKCEEMFNTFLQKINLRKPEKYSHEELQMIKEERLKRKKEEKLRKIKGVFRKELIQNSEKLFQEYGRVLSEKEISKLAEAKAKEYLEEEERKRVEKDLHIWAFIECFN